MAIRQTRSDIVYGALRADILAGRRLPGERLKFPELGKTYDVSVSVLREALTKLAGEGVVTAEPHLGYAVTELSVDALEELTDARLALECLVFARSVEQGDLQWESKIVAAHHVMEGTRYLAEGTQCVTDEWALAHSQFHDALLDGCANRRLFGMATALRSEAELYRRWSQPLGAEHDRDLVTEHRELLDAALSRDAARASVLLADHIAHTTRLLREASTHLHDSPTA
ncbi:GntR family transcriptional regulator [Gordonia sp. TBRC 11910]|uniref:GntR family transcriptional regulator n=1 Tax=Gordonia asplenii TaxID=2725283 RepID=A0A848L3N6_9ACTN|nr:GntR family transcriptional regulator [Gordonia asplenii]NMO05042.1 GntR family transcriptional regulator [Gordonia asplenii]